MLPLLILAVFALAFVAGCYQEPAHERIDPPACAELAKAHIWRELYQMTSPIPEVITLRGDCPDGRFTYPGYGCVAGLHFPGRVFVAEGDWFGNVAHEFLHVKRIEETGDPDAGHDGPGWGWNDTAVKAGKSAKRVCDASVDNAA